MDMQKPSEKYPFLVDAIYTTNPDAPDRLQTIADIIHMIELSYGRLAAGGVEQNYKKVITLDELIELEGIFLQKMKEILENKSLFDFKCWDVIYYLLESFDAEYLKKYLDGRLVNAEELVRYLDASVSISYGTGGVSHRVSDEYKKYLTTENVLQAIAHQKESGNLFNLPKNVQNNCGAFFLNSCKKFTHGNYVAQTDIDELLSEWEKESKKRKDS